jgi:hypothetical protein
MTQEPGPTPGEISGDYLSRRPVHARPECRPRPILAHPEYALWGLDLVTGAHRATNALGGVASRRWIKTAP